MQFRNGDDKVYKTKVLCIAIGFCMILGVCGRGSSSDSSLAASAPGEEECAANIAVSEIRNDSYSESKMPYQVVAYFEMVSKPKETVLSYPLTELHPFSEGRAWVYFEDNEMSCSRIIDKNWNLLYRADCAYEYLSPYSDGFTIYREDNTISLPCGIIDAK